MRKLACGKWRVVWMAVVVCLFFQAQKTWCADTLSEMPKRQLVESTSLRSVGYEPELRVLEIEFRTGAIYRYRAVPSTVHREFMAAESKGRFFSNNIRGKFAFTHVNKAVK
jgi:hypothetical protein